MSFQILTDIVEFNKAQPPADEEDIANGECPNCAWTLKTNENGNKACEICGRIYK